MAPSAHRMTAVRGEATVAGAHDAPAAAVLSHNLAGQRLGRKGRDTRERILSAAIDLIDAADGEPLSMSAIARRAALGLTSLYNYFSDLTEVMLAVLEPVMASAEAAYLAQLRERWPDGELQQRCTGFVHAYHGFWARNSQLLHLRNAMADARDQRMIAHRVGSTQPVIDLLVRQMDGQPGDHAAAPTTLATMAMIAIERSITIATDRALPYMAGSRLRLDDERFVAPGARLLELAIRDTRSLG